MSTHVYTSIAGNYLAKARVLAHTLKKFHPDFVFHAVLCDKRPSWLAVDSEPFDSILTIEDLGIANPQQWIFQHDLVELSTAVKGLALQKLLAKPGCTEVLYFDPDIVILASLDNLLAEFDAASILLTPHMAEPETSLDAIQDNEVSALQHGIYNLGFLGVKNSAEGHRFADWWCQRLEHFCYDDIPRGIFTDQRWADLVPAYFPDHKILRDATYNVCTWNLTHRSVTGSLGEGFFVNGKPVAFYHFSGFDTGAQQDMLDKYGRSMPALYELRQWYMDECSRLGQNELSQLPWAYASFDNGEPILRSYRRQYRDREDLQLAFPNPFSTADTTNSFFEWLVSNGYASDAASPHDDFDIPEYRIFLIAASGDAAFLQETLSRVRKHSFRPAHVHIVLAAGITANIEPDSGRVISLPYSSYEDLWTAVVERFSDKDMLLIRAGLLPTHKWDLRLAWSASSQEGVAAVSPIDTSQLDPAATVPNDNPELLDALCYSFRLDGGCEIASFSPECVYLRANAIKDIRTLQKQLRPTDVSQAALRLRYSQYLATHICIGSHCPPPARDNAIDRSLLLHIRDRIYSHIKDKRPPPIRIGSAVNGANLHIMHSWGGGVDRWVRDYSSADEEIDNFVLKSAGDCGVFGTELHLYRDIDDVTPIEKWSLASPIKALAEAHSDYNEILKEIVSKYAVGNILISSLIGHSLDALRQRVPTSIICHDYFPFCPAINITFGSVCSSCDESRLFRCCLENPLNDFFNNVPASDWVRTRNVFLQLVKERKPLLIAPSASVRDNYPRLASIPDELFRVVPHGTRELRPVGWKHSFSSNEPLRVLILGRMRAQKGVALLSAILPELLKFGHLTLAGCADHGLHLSENRSIAIVPNYEREGLGQLLADVRPDVALLPSIVPETFSYTLAELQQLGVPVLATRIGSFVERIEDGVTGFLAEPEPTAILERLRQLHLNRRELENVHRNLTQFPSRSAGAMVQDYNDLQPRRLSRRDYFNGPKAPKPVADRYLQLFWRTASTPFEERRSTIAKPVEGDEPQTLILRFTGYESVAGLRIDVSTKPGIFVLHALAVFDSYGRAVWTWNASPDAIDALPKHDITVRLANSRPGECLLMMTGKDPYLVLQDCFDSSAAFSSGRVEIQFRLLASETYLSENLGLHYFELADSHRELRKEYSEREKDIADKDQHIRNLETAMSIYERSLSWRITRPLRQISSLRKKIFAGR